MEYLQNVEILYYYLAGKKCVKHQGIKKKKTCGFIVVITTSMPKRENQSHLSLAVDLNLVLGRYSWQPHNAIKRLSKDTKQIASNWIPSCLLKGREMQTKCNLKQLITSIAGRKRKT